MITNFQDQPWRRVFLASAAAFAVGAILHDPRFALGLLLTPAGWLSLAALGLAALALTFVITSIFAAAQRGGSVTLCCCCLAVLAVLAMPMLAAFGLIGTHPEPAPILLAMVSVLLAVWG